MEKATGRNARLAKIEPPAIEQHAHVPAGWGLWFDKTRIPSLLRRAKDVSLTLPMHKQVE